MECLVRIAKDKYVRAGITETVTDGMEIMLNNLVLPYCKGLDPFKWRLNRYWTEECDALYKIYLNALLFVFHLYSGAEVKYCGINYMTRKEFKKFCKECIIINTLCGERETDVAFNFSKQAVINEYDNKDLTLNMYFIEFLEAFARIADKASLPPYESDENLEETLQ